VALGGLIGNDAGEGLGGLGLRGSSSSGGTGATIGLGSVGTIGHGYGRGSGALGSGKRSGSSGVVKEGTANVGGMSRDVIRRIVRRNINQFRYCYERALIQNPKLRGKVSVRFVISKEGSVSQVSDAGSTMPDGEVKACVLAGFRRLSFPAPPGGGQVVVTYPLVFETAESQKPTQPAATRPAPGAGSPPPSAPAPSSAAASSP
jgi:TonB family protein